MPKPADLIILMGSSSNYLLPDEAWTIAILASDETNAIVWTNEIAKAWSQAEIVYRNGDRISARQTFIRSYERLVDESTMKGCSIEVFISFGSDKSKCVDAINHALFTGLLTQEKANYYLSKPESNLAILALKNEKVSDNSLIHIANIRKMIKTGYAKVIES